MLGRWPGPNHCPWGSAAETPQSVSLSPLQCKVVEDETTRTDFLDKRHSLNICTGWGVAGLRGTHWLGLLHVLVSCQVDGPRVHHGAWEQVGQFGAEGGRNGLVGRREGRGHEEGRGLGCGWDHVRRVDEEARRRGGVGRHRVVDGPHARGGGRGGLVQLGLQLGLLSVTRVVDRDNTHHTAECTYHSSTTQQHGRFTFDLLEIKSLQLLGQFAFLSSNNRF